MKIQRQPAPPGRVLWGVLVCLLLATGLTAACAAPAASMPSVPALPTPSRDAIAAAAPAPTTHPITTTLESRSPAQLLPDALAAALLASLTSYQPPAVADVATVFDRAIQREALLPAHAADMEQADQWHHYVIDATLEPDTAIIQGMMTVLVRNTTPHPLNDLVFHLYPNHSDFGNGSLWVDDTAIIGGTPVAVTTEQDDVLLRVALPHLLPPDDTITATLHFRARTPVQSSTRSYGAFNQEAGVWALASFYPVLARLTDSGWDVRPVGRNGDLTVTDSALYDVQLTAPPGWSLITTGTPVEQTPLQHGTTTRTRTRIVSGPQRDFFIAAVNGLEQRSTEVAGTRITTYYQPGNPAAGQRSLDVAARALMLYNQMFGAYPYRDLALVQSALTTFFGVEYPGVMLIDQQLYHDNGTELETYIAHEVSHQWWYNVVGNDARVEPWIDEGLASIMQVLYYEAQGNPQQAADERQTFQNQYDRARRRGLDGSFSLPADSYRGAYFSLVYAKSALFFDALRSLMGDEHFAQFLRQYYQTYRYQTADGPALLALAAETCSCDVFALYDTWGGTPP